MSGKPPTGPDSMPPGPPLEDYEAPPDQDTTPEGRRASFRIASDEDEVSVEFEVFSVLDLSKIQGSDPPRYYPKKLELNIEKILELDSRFKGQIKLNVFEHRPYVRGEPVTDNLEREVRSWLARIYDLHMSTPLTGEQIKMVAARNAFHPVRDYLNSLKWDGIGRIDDMLARHFGAPNTKINAAIGSKWLTSCVARVMKPGSKVDTTMVLIGKQGARKSTALRILAVRPEWFSDSMIDFHNKDAYVALDGVWIYELSELTAVSGRDVNTVKSFLSSQSDKYRPAYGRNKVDQPRETVFCGSTNSEQWLNDATGSRRFWPVVVGNIDIAALEGDRDQLWAEAMHRYQRGRIWHLTPEESEMLEEIHGDHEHADPWIEHVSEWINRNAQDRYTTATLLWRALGVTKDKQTRGDSMRLSDVMQALGFRRDKKRPRGWGAK